MKRTIVTIAATLAVAAPAHAAVVHNAFGVGGCTDPNGCDVTYADETVTTTVPTSLPTDTLPPYGPAVDVSRGLAAALAYWGHAPDCPDGVAATLFDDPNPNIAARGAFCHIWIDQSVLQRDVAYYGSAAAAVNTCDAVVHEVGHLLGHDHSDVATADDPLDIMNGSVLNRVPQCADPETPTATPDATSPTPDAAPVRSHHRRKHRHHHYWRKARAWRL